MGLYKAGLTVLLVIVFVACASMTFEGSEPGLRVLGNYFLHRKSLPCPRRCGDQRTVTFASSKRVVKRCDVERSPPCDLRLEVFHGGRNETSSRLNEAGRK